MVGRAVLGENVLVLEELIESEVTSLGNTFRRKSRFLSLKLGKV